MKNVKVEKNNTTTTKVSKRLNKYKDKVLFPQKVAEANRVLKEVGLPKELFK